MTAKQRSTIILILGTLTALGPFSIDMYLPSFPAIAQDLKTDIAHVTLSLSSYFIGISIGQLIYGPLIDRFGRKKPLMIGLGIYILAALGCVFAPNVFALIGLRFLLALGGCVGMVAGRAVVRDLFPVSENAKIFSTLILVMGIAPIIAPSVGSFIGSHIGWRFIFVALALFASLLLLSVASFLPESKGADRSVSLKFTSIVREYFEVLKNKTFVTYAVGGGLIWAGLYTYISGSTFVYMNIFGFSEKQFGLLFALNACGLILGSQLNRQLLKKMDSVQVIHLMSWLLLGTAALLVLSNFVELPLVAFLGLLFVNLFWLGFMNPNATALAMSPFKRNAGSASAMMGFLQMLIGASASALVSRFHNGTSQPMTLVMAAGSVLGFGVIFFNTRAQKLQQS